MQFDSAGPWVSEELRAHRLNNVEATERPWQNVAILPAVLLPNTVIRYPQPSDLPIGEVRLGARLIGLLRCRFCRLWHVPIGRGDVVPGAYRRGSTMRQQRHPTGWGSTPLEQAAGRDLAWLRDRCA